MATLLVFLVGALAVYFLYGLLVHGLPKLVYVVVSAVVGAYEKRRDRASATSRPSTRS